MSTVSTAASAVPNDSLMSLLITNLGKKEAERIYKAFLQPFYEAVNKQFPLPLPAGLSEEALKQQIRAALVACGAKCEKVVFVSLSQQLLELPNPEWMTQAAYETYKASFAASFWASLGTSLGDILKASQKRIALSYSKTLWASLRVSLGDILPPFPENEIGGSAIASIRCFLDFTLAKKPKEVKRLQPLIRLLPYAIPLGEKADESGTWIVAVA